MRIRWADLILLVVILAGAIPLWRGMLELGTLQTEHDRLKSIAGELDVVDPSKIYIRALPRTKDPLEFAWRVYLPPKFKLHTRNSGGSSSWSFREEATNGIYRISLREIDGQMMLYEKTLNSSGLGSVNSPVEQFARKHQDRLIAEQTGDQKTEEFDPAQEFTLLKLSLPGDAAEEAKAADGRIEGLPAIYEFFIGPQANGAGS